jgi:hypothetical protein
LSFTGFFTVLSLRLRPDISKVTAHERIQHLYLGINIYYEIEIIWSGQKRPMEIMSVRFSVRGGRHNFNVSAGMVSIVLNVYG